MLRVVLTLAVLFSAHSLCAETLKVLMIGNSFSASVLKQLPGCAANAGETLDIAALSIGGCSLQTHWENVVAADAYPTNAMYGLTDSYASGDTGLRKKLGSKTNIQKALTNDTWDIVTIQQNSANSYKQETYEPYAGNLIAKIRQLAPDAEIVIQETWSYSEYGAANKSTTQAAMYEGLKEAYSLLSRNHGNLRIIPTGDAVQLYRKRLPVDYSDGLANAKSLKKADTIDFRGDLAGESAWKTESGSDKLDTDLIHLNGEGEYLQACVWLAKLFGTGALGRLTYAPRTLTDAKARLMRLCALDAVEASNR